ncbi:MAG: hypothetical protein ACPG8W_00170 [Candidatus Promineifilaceae bacterium]
MTLTQSLAPRPITQARTVLSRWWQKTLAPAVDRLVMESAEHNQTLSTASVGLSAASVIFFPPLKLLIAPTLLLTALPACQTMIETWRRDKAVHNHTLKVLLTGGLIATNHLLVGAVGTWLLTQCDNNTTETDGPPLTLSGLAIGVLALPVAGVSGGLAALFAAAGYDALKPIAAPLHNKHDMVVRNLPAALRLPTVDVVLLDQNCLVQTELLGVQAYGHHAPDEIIYFAMLAATPTLPATLRKHFPQLVPDTHQIDVLLRPALDTQDFDSCPEAIAMQRLEVVVSGHSIGALDLTYVPLPQARLLLHALREKGFTTQLLSNLSEPQTAKLASEFDIDAYQAELSTDDKRLQIFTLQQNGQTVCFIGREQVIASDLTLSLEAGSLDSDVSLSENALPQLLSHVEQQTRQLNLFKRLRVVPVALTTGSIFFFHWGLPAAVTVQAVGWFGYQLLAASRRRGS